MKRLKEGRRKLASEFVVIVVGVLVALWIDAGWSWVQDRSDERVLIRDLISDFEGNLRGVEETLASHDRLFEIGTRFVQGGGVEAFPEDSLEEVASTLVRVESFNPQTGALDGAIGSGRIELLRDDDLRAALAAWSGYYMDASEEIEWLMPLAISLARSSSTYFLMGDPTAWLELLAEDQELSDLLAFKIATLYEVRGDTQALRDHTARILDLLAEQ